MAIDTELVEQPVPPALARRARGLGGVAFWQLWTRAEVRAKLRDVPILEWLRLVDWVGDGDLPGAEQPLAVMTRVEVDRVVSYGLVMGGAQAPRP